MDAIRIYQFLLAAIERGELRKFDSLSGLFRHAENMANQFESSDDETLRTILWSTKIWQNSWRS